MTHRIGLIVWSALLAGLGACGSDLATGVHSTAERPSFILGNSCQGTRTTGLNNFYPHWNCGAAIDLVALGITSPEDVATVQNEWNNALHAQALNLPYFTDAGTRRQIPVRQTSGTTNFAGNVFPTDVSLTPDSIDMHNGVNGEFLPVLLTESTHIIGFGDYWEKAVVTGVTDHCAGRTTGSSTPYVNTSVCQHEVEYVYYAYNMRSTEPNEHKHIVTGVDGLPNDLQLYVGDTLTAKVTNLLLNRVNPSLCDDRLCRLDPARAVFTWSGSNSAVSFTTSSNASRTLKALAPGAATIAVNFAPSDTNEHTALFGTTFSRNSFTVTVVARPDLAPGTITAPASVGAGTSFSVSLQEKNLSSTQVPAGWTGRLYLSMDGILSAGDSLVGTFIESSAIASSTTITTSRTANVPATLTLGNYHVVAVLDATNVVVEASEANNSGASADSIAVTAVPPRGFGTAPALCKATTTTVRYLLTWTKGSGATYEIRQGVVDDVNQGTLMSSGPSATTSALTPFYSRTTPPLVHYWWLRELAANGTPGPWFPDAINGQSAADGCVF
jgi:hypothetical protein